MGPRSENRGYARRVQPFSRCRPASMGPRSENRGYAGEPECELTRALLASMGPRSENRGYEPKAWTGVADGQASMGPRSENRGYGLGARSAGEDHRASMGPRSENRGYGSCSSAIRAGGKLLQWVHGLRTVVMRPAGSVLIVMPVASMGPRSENRGYENGWHGPLP